MERGIEDSSRVPEQREGLVLGYFLQLLRYVSPTSVLPSHSFVPSTPEGNDLKQLKWGDLDETLNFLGQNNNPYIVGSSNGFLLCTTYTSDGEKSQLVICNPVTKEFRVLPPESPKRFDKVVAFTCKVDDGMPSMEMVNYEIILTQQSSSMPNLDGPKREKLELQFFSSETDEWKHSCIESPSRFDLEGCNSPAIVLEEMVYWKAGSNFVAYNRHSGHLEVMKVPYPDDGDDHVIIEEDIVIADCLCVSNGKLSYGISFKQRLEVWVLHDCANGRADWNMKFSVSHRMMIQNNPSLKKIHRCYMQCLHPHNPHLVIVHMGVNMYCCDMISGKLEELRTSFNPFSYTSFPYEWPSNLLLDVSN